MANYFYFNHKEIPLNIYFSHHYFSNRIDNNKNVNKERYIKNLDLFDITTIIDKHIDKMMISPGKYLFSLFKNNNQTEQAHIIIAFEKASSFQPFDFEITVITSAISNTINAKFKNFGVNRIFVNDIYLDNLTLFSDTEFCINTLNSIHNRFIKFDLMKEEDTFEIDMNFLFNIFKDNCNSLPFHHFVSLRESFELLLKNGDFPEIKQEFNNLISSFSNKPVETLPQRKKIIIKRKKIKINFNLISLFDIDMVSDLHFFVNDTKVLKSIRK